jgi:hypothetical protein
MSEQVVTRYECQECGATWPGRRDWWVISGSFAAHSAKWHEGRETVAPVMATVIVEEPTAEVLVERARKLGAEHGHNAGTWVDVSSEDDAREAIQRDNLGELFELYDIAGPLSGEWADGMTPDYLMESIGAPEPEVPEGSSWLDVANAYELQNEVCDAYEQAYYDAWREEVLRMARYQVGDSDG